MDPWASPWAEEQVTVPSASSSYPAAVVQRSDSPAPPLASPTIDPWAAATDKPYNGRQTDVELTSPPSFASEAQSRTYRADVATDTRQSVQAIDTETADPWAEPSTSAVAASSGWQSWRPTNDHEGDREEAWARRALAEPVISTIKALPGEVEEQTGKDATSIVTDGMAEPASQPFQMTVGQEDWPSRPLESLASSAPSTDPQISITPRGILPSVFTKLSAATSARVKEPASVSAGIPSSSSSMNLALERKLAAEAQTEGEGWQMKKKPAPSALAGIVGGWLSQAKSREDPNPIVRGNDEDSDDEGTEQPSAEGSNSKGGAPATLAAFPTRPVPDLLTDQTEEAGSTKPSTSARGPSAVGRLLGRWRKPAAESTPASTPTHLPPQNSGDIDADGLDWLARADAPEAMAAVRAGQSETENNLFDFNSLAVAAPAQKSTIKPLASSQQVAPRPEYPSVPYSDMPTATSAYRDVPVATSVTPAVAAAAAEDWSWLDEQVIAGGHKQSATLDDLSSSHSTSSLPAPHPVVGTVRHQHLHQDPLRPHFSGPPKSSPTMSTQTTGLTRSDSSGDSRRGALLPPPPPPPAGRSTFSAAGMQTHKSPSSTSASQQSTLDLQDFLIDASSATSKPTPVPIRHGGSPLSPPLAPAVRKHTIATSQTTSMTPMSGREPGRMTKDDLLFFESLG